MCGRYVSASPPSEIANYFGASILSEKVLEPSFNVAPTNDVYAVVDRDGQRVLDELRWGLLPIWAKDIKAGSSMINARAENISTKNAYRHAFRKQRCIIPADGFFEWHKIEGQKHKEPMYIHRVDGEPIAFAGLWETWRGPERDQPPLYTCTIITTTPNELMARIHNRMPVILPPSRWEEWLDPSFQDLETLQGFLVPAPSELLTMYPVSTAVNNVRNKDAIVIAPKGDIIFSQSSGTDAP